MVHDQQPCDSIGLPSGDVFFGGKEIQSDTSEVLVQEVVGEIQPDLT